MYTKTALLVLVASLAYAAAKETTKEEQADLIFDTIDADNDGKITLKEAETFYGKVGVNVAAIEAGFKKADKNGDKYVTKEEFKEYAKDISAPKKEDLLAVVFDAIDKDNDNYISLDESKKFYTALGSPIADIEAGFKASDKDGDGKVSFKEFKEYAYKKH